MNDEKIAADYKVQGGSVLHLVLALRGGNEEGSRVSNIESFTSKKQLVTNLLVQDAKEQRKGRKEQE